MGRNLCIQVIAIGSTKKKTKNKPGLFTTLPSNNSTMEKVEFLGIFSQEISRDSVAQSVGHLTCKSGVLGLIPSLAT